MSYNITMEDYEYEECVIALLKEVDKYKDDMKEFIKKVCDSYFDAGVSPNNIFEGIRNNEIREDSIDSFFGSVLGNDYSKVLGEYKDGAKSFSDISSSDKQDCADALKDEVESNYDYTILHIDTDTGKVIFEG